MREDLLHFIWKYKKLQLSSLMTTDNQAVEIYEVGQHNYNSGPDFFNAKLKIGNQLWAGNVEIHINSSDWFAHKHEIDEAYENVILHVVWEDDVEIRRKDNSLLQVLQLKSYISNELLNDYKRLFSNQNKQFINCERDIANIDSFIIDNWLSRLYVERLQDKSNVVKDLLKETKNDWEQVLFKLLLANFGLKINGQSFMSIANVIDFSIVRKLNNQFEIEALLMGVAGMLENDEITDEYFLNLRAQFEFLKSKFRIHAVSVIKPEYYKLRPTNFPTIRLSQFAHLYSEHKSLFGEIIKLKSLSQYYDLFTKEASSYWGIHFTFGKQSRKSRKKLTNSFVDLLLINTIIPIQFEYNRIQGKDNHEVIFSVVSSIKPEKNNVIEKFGNLGVSIKSARESQSVLQLYNTYCKKNKCLQCAVGSRLLGQNI